MEVLPPNQLGHRCVLAVAVSTGTFDQQSPVASETSLHYTDEKETMQQTDEKETMQQHTQKGGKQPMVIDQMCKLHNLIFFKNGSV
jgi:hypothetical protein